MFTITNFKDSHYTRVHYWVVKQMGRPSKCEKCGTTDEKKRYHWSNISQKYLFDLNDWQRLCVSCHWKYDIGDMCKRKLHSLTGDNLRIDPRNPNWRSCKTCTEDARRRRNATNQTKVEH